MRLERQTRLFTVSGEHGRAGGREEHASEPADEAVPQGRFGSRIRRRPVHLGEAGANTAEHRSMASASASWANGFASRANPDAAVPCSSA